MRPQQLALLLSLCVAACARVPTTAVGNRADARSTLGWSEVLRLRAARDYFTLRDRLEASAASEEAPTRFGRALVQHAFNASAASNATIAALLADGRLPDTLATELRRVQLANYLRLFAYEAGLAAADTLLSDTTRLDRAALQDLRNTRRLFRALANVPAQTADLGGPSTLRMQRGRIPVRVNDSLRNYVFDTGANLSTIMRSEATALGLHIYPASLDVGTSTDRRVVADLGVADHLTLGRAQFHHVVFLVLDDSLLTFSGGFRIPGIVGFPVIAQLGEVQFGPGGGMVIPERPAVRTERNLALDELTLLTRAGWEGAPLLCRLDTGAGRTQFYEPFYRRFRARLDETTSPATRRTGGAGGVRELSVRVLLQVRLALGETIATLDSADIFTQSIVRDATQNYLDCNVGHDVLDAFPHYTINFRDMAFLLR